MRPVDAAPSGIENSTRHADIRGCRPDHLLNEGRSGAGRKVRIAAVLSRDVVVAGDRKRDLAGRLTTDIDCNIRADGASVSKESNGTGSCTGSRSYRTDSCGVRYRYAGPDRVRTRRGKGRGSARLVNGLRVSVKRAATCIKP